MVGAADLVLTVWGFCPSLETGRDCLLWESETSLMLRPEGGVQKDKCPFVLCVADASVAGLPETG